MCFSTGKIILKSTWRTRTTLKSRQRRLKSILNFGSKRARSFSKSSSLVQPKYEINWMKNYSYFLACVILKCLGFFILWRFLACTKRYDFRALLLLPITNLKTHFSSFYSNSICFLILLRHLLSKFRLVYGLYLLPLLSSLKYGNTYSLQFWQCL